MTKDNAMFFNPIQPANQLIIRKLMIQMAELKILFIITIRLQVVFTSAN